MGNPSSTLSIEEVVTEGFCVGCGACAATPSSPFEMTETSTGTYTPLRVSKSDDRGERLARYACPFSGVGPDEDQLAQAQFGELRRDGGIGSWRQIRAAHVTEGNFRELGTSGGMTSWFLAELFRRDLIDAVIHVRANDDKDGPLFGYDLSTSPETSTSWVKSRYHVVEMSAAVELLRRNPGRFAFVGVPCFVKAVRLLVDTDEELRRNLVATVALVCGHLKSARYAEFAAWQMGISPGNLSEFDFRTKIEGRPANLYAMTASGTNPNRQNVTIRKGAEDIRWSDWGLGLFKLKACDYCDDVVGETADISMGDAWIPPYSADWRGTNLVITRSALAEEIVAGGEIAGAVHAVPLTAEDASATQAAGLRHRRGGLAIRLAAREQRGQFVPKKRVVPNPTGLNTPDGKRYLIREQIAEASHLHYETAREQENLDVFFALMRAQVKEYYGSTKATALAWMIQRIEQLLPNRVLSVISKVHTERNDRRRRAREARDQPR